MQVSGNNIDRMVLRRHVFLLPSVSYYYLRKRVFVLRTSLINVARFRWLHTFGAPEIEVSVAVPGLYNNIVFPRYRRTRPPSVSPADRAFLRRGRADPRVIHATPVPVGRDFTDHGPDPTRPDGPEKTRTVVAACTLGLRDGPREIRMHSRRRPERRFSRTFYTATYVVRGKNRRNKRSPPPVVTGARGGGGRRPVTENKDRRWSRRAINNPPPARRPL